jgi:hypothetical protein
MSHPRNDIVTCDKCHAGITKGGGICKYCNDGPFCDGCLGPHEKCCDFLAEAAEVQEMEGR